jgi:LuxR family transcriptional regulator, maltose regulon positive regulatory protein
MIDTKLLMPGTRAVMVTRRHLLDRLTSAKDHQLLVIKGPAASGKTSLIVQWLNKAHLQAAWYSVDKEDNEGDLFFRYFLAALCKVETSLARPLSPLLKRQRRIAWRELIPKVIQALMGLRKEVYLVIDDYHLVDSEEIHQAAPWCHRRGASLHAPCRQGTTLC